MKFSPKAGPNWSGFFFPSVLSLLLLGACQNPSTSGSESESENKVVTRNDGPTRSFLGLSKKEALSKAAEMKLKPRIVREDMERFRMTKDLRSDRINFELDKGEVTSAKIF